MEWISWTLREASKSKGNSVRRWKKKDAFSEIYCARNFNKFGRYISLINIRGRRRAVIIIPELNFNSGWTGIAEKVGRFISSHKRGGELREA
uniref:Putative ovule protein n=1 Tax=Solanum chacoense TaxID=4108 RepID=A0A0V0HU48_SOLCH